MDYPKERTSPPPRSLPWHALPPRGGRVPADPGEAIALVAASKREVLLAVHGFRLRADDLEECLSQATLELLLAARRGRAFESSRHIANALEQRFLSRIADRRRALGGRSPLAAALEAAGTQTGSLAVPDRGPTPEQLVEWRALLRRVPALVGTLTRDQQLVLASQVSAQEESAVFCARHGWTREKYRKVAQRARTRLRSLVSADGLGAVRVTSPPMESE